MLDAGIHFDVPSADYYADPAPQPSFTQSLAKILLERSPLHAWHAHPRLNPDYRHDDDTKFDIGNTAHAILLGRGKDIVVAEFDDWRTKAAQTAREEAAAAGKLAVLGKQYSRANRMAEAAREQLQLRKLQTLFTDGQGEVVLLWQEGKLWLRQMLDWLSGDQLTVVDYKTTDYPVSPNALPRLMLNAGWHIQAAMAERGLDALDAGSSGYRRYLFVAQETAPPYALSVARISEAALTMGRKQLFHAVDVWMDCMVANRFPGYPNEITTPEFPAWAEQQWLTQEVEADARRQFDPNILMAG